MHRPGRKLAITGKGRCNMTNNAPLADFIRHFGPNGRFLRGAFHAFFTEDLIRLLDELGVPTVTERGGRVFPASQSAPEVVAALQGWVQARGVTLHNHAPVERLLVVEGRIAGVQVGAVSTRATRAEPARQTPPRPYHAPAVILATGGAS
jgi:predicted flavoprotein YhiN